MYDVIIAGSGITGTCMGMILAKNGLKVLIIELGKHPRFALGESLLPKHVYGWGSQDHRHVDFANPELVQQLLGWGFSQSPSWLREKLFDFSLPAM